MDSQPDLLAVADMDLDLAWHRAGGLEWLGPEDFSIIEADADSDVLKMDAMGPEPFAGALFVTRPSGLPDLRFLEREHTILWNGRLPHGLGQAIVCESDDGQFRVAIVERNGRIGVFCAHPVAFEARGGVMMLATVVTSIHYLPAAGDRRNASTSLSSGAPAAA